MAACNFGKFLGEALRDQLVCGIRTSNTQRKLLSEDRSFDQAMQMALANEVADAEAKQIAPHTQFRFHWKYSGRGLKPENTENEQSPTTTYTYASLQQNISKTLLPLQLGPPTSGVQI